MQTLETRDAESRTVGQTLGTLRLIDAIAALGFIVVAAGSVAPWATTILGSLSGFNGDGKITGGLAVAGLTLLMVRWLPLASLAGLAALGVGLYDLLRLHHAVHDAVLFGAHIAQVGSGPYAVVAGGVVALLACAEGCVQR